MAKNKKEKTAITIIALEAKKSTMKAGKEYEVSQNVADVLVKAKRAKLA